MAANPTRAGSKKCEVDVNTLLQKLQLNDADRDGVVLAKEERENLPKVKWLAIKQFSDQSLSSTMMAAWNPTREVTFRPIARNLYMVQASCLGEWKRIMEDGPWLFRGCALMLEEYDGATPLPSVEPNRVQVWIQIHKIPPLYRTEKILKQLAGKVGEVISVEMKAIPTSGGDFHRARVNLLASKPLTRFVTLAPEGQESMLLLVQYEKMAQFCAHCGVMGHTHLECGTGEHGEEALQYGDWMLAAAETWRAGTPRVRGIFNAGKDGPRGRSATTDKGRTTGAERTKHATRGGPRTRVWKEKETQGSESSGARKRMLEEAGLDGDILDTASSPGKGVVTPVENVHGKSSAQKQLILEPSASASSSSKGIPPPPPQYVPPREQKRMKRAAARSANSSPLKPMAAS